MGLFLYDSSMAERVIPDLQQVRKRCRDLVTLGADHASFRSAVRVLMRHSVLVVPTDVALLSPVVQRIQQIAHITGIRVVPLASYLTTNARANRPLRSAQKATAPVAASAVPPTQHPAAAGQPIHT